jgi:hypothetical protein
MFIATTFYHLYGLIGYKKHSNTLFFHEIKVQFQHHSLHKSDFLYCLYFFIQNLEKRGNYTVGCCSWAYCRDGDSNVDECSDYFGIFEVIGAVV